MIWFKQLLYALKEKSNKDYVFQAMIASMFSIVVCMVCLVGGTFAWFTATATVSTQTITAANINFKTVVEETDISSEKVAAVAYTEIESKEIIAQDDIYSLVANKNYTITLTVEGTATKGFAIVTLGGKKMLTPQMSCLCEEDKTVSFSVTAYEPVEMAIFPCWGAIETNPDSSMLITTFDSEENLFISDGMNIVIGTPTEVIPEESEESVSKSIGFDFEGLMGENLDWKPEVEWEDQLIYPNLDYKVVFIPEKGYHLAEIITVVIDDVVYEVYTDGLEHRELTDGQMELPPMPAFNKDESILTIPAILLTEETQNVRISANVEPDDLGSEEPLEPETSIVPDTSLESNGSDESKVPTEPVVPEETETPTEPTIPDEPEISTNPNVPDEPEILTDPNVPDESEIPTNPNVSDEQETPIDQVVTGEPDISEDSTVIEESENSENDSVVSDDSEKLSEETEILETDKQQDIK